MASTHYVGQTPGISELLGEGQPRYFYALRRTEDGTLFFAKIDQLKDTDTITVNNPGASADDFTEFEYGVDFFDGRKAYIYDATQVVDGAGAGNGGGNGNNGGGNGY